MEQLKKDMERIAGDWNGEDERYISGGDVYTEEHAHIATEILDHIEKIEVLQEALTELR